MGYTYTPTYYSSLHVTSLCKTILPFSFKKRRLPASDHKLAKQQSDNLKWQQDAFHHILNLMGLHKEGILPETEVSAYRLQLLETLIASPREQEHVGILRDKLVFLQELFYAKCISEDEYHSSKRPLLQRLAVQGAEIEARDIIVGGSKENTEEEWSVIDLKDENSNSKNKSKHISKLKNIKGAASIFSFGSSQKNDSKLTNNELGLSKENPFWDSHLRERESDTKSILMPESLPQNGLNGSSNKAKKKPSKTTFQKESGENGGGFEEKVVKTPKKQWGFDGFKKWKKSNAEDETSPLPLNDERSDSRVEFEACRLVSSPIGEGPDTKLIKRKLHNDGSSSDFFIDKVLGDKIKKELSRIQTELCTTNPNLHFSNDQIEAISTRLPVDKADLKKFFPKSWCDRYGDVVLDVVKKEFKDHVGEMENMRNDKDHVGEMENMRNNTKEKQNNSSRWATFDDDENCNPNLFVHQDHSTPLKQQNFPTCNTKKSGNTTRCFENNPFSNEEDKMRPESAFFEYQNPFWSPRQQHY